MATTIEASDVSSKAIEPPLEQLQANTGSPVGVDNPSDDPKSPQMELEDEGKEDSVDGEIMCTTVTQYNTVSCTCTCMYTSMILCIDYVGDLLLNMTVDNNCKHLEYLEAELVKLQAAG